MKQKIIAISAILILVIASIVSGARIGDSARVEVTLISQEPDPAEPGQVLDVRFKIENLGGGGTEDIVFEIFITPHTTDYVFNHVCIKVPDKEDFVKKCEKNNLKPFFVDKGDKKLLFTKDYFDNLYEVK